MHSILQRVFFLLVLACVRRFRSADALRKRDSEIALAATAVPRSATSSTGKVFPSPKRKARATSTADKFLASWPQWPCPIPSPTRRRSRTRARRRNHRRRGGDPGWIPSGKYRRHQERRRHRAQQAVQPNLHQPQPGEKVPDFALVNQDGKRIHLNSVQRRGDARHVHLHALPFSRLLPAGLPQFRADLRSLARTIRRSIQDAPAERELRSRSTTRLRCCANTAASFTSDHRRKPFRALGVRHRVAARNWRRYEFFRAYSTIPTRRNRSCTR